MNIDLYNRDYFCQSLTYISGLCSFLSVWFVVGFTVERFIAVRYPLKRQTMCTVKRARLTLAALILIGSIICIPYLLYAAPVYSEDAKYTICDVREEYKVSDGTLDCSRVLSKKTKFLNRCAAARVDLTTNPMKPTLLIVRVTSSFHAIHLLRLSVCDLKEQTFLKSAFKV